jgi:hypothetical protein
MSHHGGYQHEMGRFENVSDGELERLLAGKVLHGEEELGALTSFVRDMKDTYQVSPDGTSEARHLAAIFEAAHLLADKSEPVARPASKADGPATQASGLPKKRRKLVSARLDSIVARTVVGVAVFATTGSFAFAGTLPDPLQQAAVDVADTVGVTLPDPDESSSDENDDAPNGVLDDVEAVEPEDSAVLAESDDEDDDPDDDGADDETDANNQGAAGGAGAAANNADDSEDTETAGGANQGAAGADDSDDSKQGNGQAGAAGNQSDATDETNGAGQQQQQQQDDEETEDDTEEQSEDT